MSVWPDTDVLVWKGVALAVMSVTAKQLCRQWHGGYADDGFRAERGKPCRNMFVMSADTSMIPQ